MDHLIKFISKNARDILCGLKHGCNQVKYISVINLITNLHHTFNLACKYNNNLNNQQQQQQQQESGMFLVEHRHWRVSYKGSYRNKTIWPFSTTNLKNRLLLLVMTCTLLRHYYTSNNHPDRRTLLNERVVETMGSERLLYSRHRPCFPLQSTVWALFGFLLWNMTNSFHILGKTKTERSALRCWFSN